MIANVYLKRGKEESLKRCHLWIFSGAIARIEGEEQLTEGDIVDVYTSERKFIARGHYQIGSITVRVLTFEQEEINTEWWTKRIREAYQVRQAEGLIDNEQTTCYRLIHGEGDMLSGLVVDVYGSTAVVQCHSVGMFYARTEIAKAIKAVYGDKIESVYDKSSRTLPFKAGIDTCDGYLTENRNHAGFVLENGLKFEVNWEEGQKTGFFIDQRVNRELVRRYAKGRRVLNTFCYTGGFSVYAADGGATEVVSVDSSERAVELAARNMTLNFGEQYPHRAVAMDTFDFLKEMDDSFDLVILDPPAFAKHHKVAPEALKAYKRLNAKAMQKIKSGGILFTFSCSQAVNKEQFRMAVFSAAAIAGRRVRIMHQLTQPEDHPINIYHPESEYLKGLVLYIE